MPCMHVNNSQCMNITSFNYKQLAVHDIVTLWLKRYILSADRLTLPFICVLEHSIEHAHSWYPV